jgi:RNA polymerase nonessential primary-like sigma factor
MWIRQAITRASAQQARTIRLPINVTEKLNQIKKTQRELAQK